MPDLRSGSKGDLYAKVMIQVPKKLDAEQKQILEDFGKTIGEDVIVKDESLKDKIKKVFK